MHRCFPACRRARQCWPRGSPASLPPPVTAGLPPCPAAAVLLPVVWAALQAGLDRRTDGRTALPRAVPEACGQPALGAAGWWGGNIGEGDKRRSRSPANPVAGTAPMDLLITGHRRGSQTGTAEPWPAQGRAPRCDKQHPAALEGTGTVHGSGELPGMLETTTTFTFPAKGSSQAAALAATGLGVT